MVPVWVLNCNYPCTDRAIVLHWCAFCYLQNYSCVYPAAAARLLLCLFHMLWLRLPPSAPLPFIRSLSSAFFILSVYSTPPLPPSLLPSIKFIRSPSISLPFMRCSCTFQPPPLLSSTFTILALPPFSLYLDPPSPRLSSLLLCFLFPWSLHLLSSFLCTSLST